MNLKIIDYTVMDMKFAYIAGFFDGEGCIHVIKPRLNLRLSASNTDQHPLNFMCEILGGSVNKKSESCGNRKACYQWLCNGVMASEALEKLLPYLIVKKERALLCIELPYATKRKRKEVAGKMTILNKRGSDR